MPIYQKINQIMRRVVGVEKDGTNKFGNYDFQSHNAVTRALRGHYAEMGVVREASIESLEVIDGGHIKVKGYVTFTDVEDSSDVTVLFCTVQHCQTKDGKVTAQQTGQALSYAVKNVELKLFALTDTEGDSDASHPTPDQEAQTPRVTPDVAKERATELLKLMGMAKTSPEIEDIMGMVKAEWASLKDVENFQVAMKAQKASAIKRTDDDIPY